MVLNFLLNYDSPMSAMTSFNPLNPQIAEIPLAPDSIKTSEASDAKLLASRIQVMLVEDSALIREALIDALASSPVANFEGFATTADDAVTALRARQYDIAVVDIELARGTGFDVLLNINQSDFPYPPPISIVLTNHAHPVYKYQAELLGVRHFFDKSMHFDEAIDAIEQEARRLLSRKSQAE